MTSDAIILIGRDARTGTEVLATHASRLRRRGAADTVTVATYEDEPERELRSQFTAVDAEEVYAVPTCVAHSYDTVEAIPAALSAVSGTVFYCEPPGQHPAATDAVVDRADSAETAGANVSLVLVGFGSSATDTPRRTADYHADRVRADSGYGQVLTCYLTQNPAVECVRYNVSSDRAVAVPLFVARSEATERRIPEALSLDRSGVAYADPLGDHDRLTDAIEGVVDRQRRAAGNASSGTQTAADVDGPSSAGVDAPSGRLDGAPRPPLAADGQGTVPSVDDGATPER